MDQLAFFSGSADLAPGKGAHEVVARKEDYRVLADMKDWRKRLSNFDTEVEFVQEGRTYRSIEHAFQATKIALKDPEKAALFSLESGSELSRGTGADAQKKRKMVLLGPTELAHWSAVSADVMAAIARAKQTQHPTSLAAQTLKATGKAELWHLVRQRGKPSQLVRFAHLETLRDELP